MAYLTGLKKQINKANQYMTEKISGVEGEKLKMFSRIKIDTAVAIRT